ncbi:MAG TPA: prepilin peptidase [Planctomycetota bacterium]|nr:prepilin peptidase [Planctomycetota bacterium]
MNWRFVSARSGVDPPVAMSSLGFQVTAGAFGACIGSFLNVVVHRLPQEQPAARSLGGRSRCPHCGAAIRWRDNLPIASWLLLRGKARCCGKPITGRYLAVEALTAGLFVLLAAYPPHGPVVDGSGAIAGAKLLALGLDLLFTALLVACSFIDLEHRILPDALTKPGMAIGVAGSFLYPALPGAFADGADLPPALLGILSSITGLLCGFGITWLIRAGAGKLFGREAMGFGDVKFLGMIGAFLGWKGAMLTLLLGCVVGAVIGVGHRLLTREATIPFGPFLALGALLSLGFWQRIESFLFETWPQWLRDVPAAPWILSVSALVSLLGLVVLVRRGRGNG